jgi:hypothetical protein
MDERARRRSEEDLRFADMVEKMNPMRMNVQSSDSFNFLGYATIQARNEQGNN